MLQGFISKEEERLEGANCSGQNKRETAKLKFTVSVSIFFSAFAAKITGHTSSPPSTLLQGKGAPGDELGSTRLAGDCNRSRISLCPHFSGHSPLAQSYTLSHPHPPPHPPTHLPIPPYSEQYIYICCRFNLSIDIYGKRQLPFVCCKWKIETEN
jgi:hypothetical protein